MIPTFFRKSVEKLTVVSKVKVFIPRHKNFVYFAALNLPCGKCTSQGASFRLGYGDKISK